MAEIVLTSKLDQAQAIAAISDQLQLPVGQVGRVFQKEFERLKAQARISTYLTVLTMRNVRSILRGARKRGFTCPFMPASASCHPDPRARGIRVMCTGFDALCAQAQEGGNHVAMLND